MKIKEIVIVYFSATGNTLFAAKEIQKHLQSAKYSAKLVSAEDIHIIEQIDFSDKMLGIGFPCYAFDYPHEVMDKALKAIKTPVGKVPAFIFSTYCIGDGLSKKNMLKALSAKNFTTVLSGGFKCPSSGFYTLKSGKEKGIRKLLVNRVTTYDKDIKSRIQRFSNKIINASKKDRLKKVRMIKPNIISLLPMAFAKWNEKRIFTGFSIDNEKCSMCKTCLKNCPVNNFEIADEKILFVNNEDCLRCTRCINSCPKDAISLGKATIGKLRYNKKTRERLLNKK